MTAEKSAQVRSTQLNSTQLNSTRGICTCTRRRVVLRGGLAAAAPAADCAVRAPRTPATLLTVARPAPVTCASARRPMRPAPPPGGLCGWRARRTEAALRRRGDLRQRVKRSGVSRGRRGCEVRAAQWRWRRHPAAPRPRNMATRTHMRPISRTGAPRSSDHGGRWRGRWWR